MSKSIQIINEMRALANPAEARNLMRFFKTGAGQYGEGDQFLGIRVPASRAIVKQHARDTSIEDVDLLLSSQYHEIRLVGFLLLIEIYKQLGKKKDSNGQRIVVDYYLSKIERGNNWDLVDQVAPKILGAWIVAHPHESALLYQLAEMDGNLWHQRVAIVATWTIIRSGEYSHTFRIAQRLMHHPHDLIHKAVGWMLREVGKNGGKPQLLQFLDTHAPRMPRTMLRYSIEHFTPNERQHYMHTPRQ